MSLSSQQRLELILTYYILYKMRKEPRVLKQYMRHYITNRVTTDHNHLTNVTANQHHTAFTQAVADGLYVDEAGDTMTGDLVMSGADILMGGNTVENALQYKTANMNINEFNAETLQARRNLDDAVRDFLCRRLLLNESMRAQATTVYFYARNIATGAIRFNTLSGGSTTCAELKDKEFSIPCAGDIDMVDANYVTFDKASGNGIKVDTTAPTFGWRDLLGEIRTRGVGATDPNDAVYDGVNIRAYQFSVNDECWIDYHIPHDYEIGTDIHLHFHWSHNGTLVTGGNVTWAADITYAKGHNQAAFPATVNPTVVGTASTIQYRHIITEVQISDPAPGAAEIDTDNLEPDGVIMIRAYLSANNITVSGGAVPDPFLHFVDVHYQTTNIGTKDKVPDFYT